MLIKTLQNQKTKLAHFENHLTEATQASPVLRLEKSRIEEI